MKLNKLKILAIVLVIAIALIFTACGEQAEIEIAATVNGEQIETSVLEYRLGIQLKQFEAFGFPLEEEQIDDFRKALLDELIRDALARQAAEGEGIALEPGAVDAEINAIKEEWGEEVFRTTLEEYFLTEDDLREMLEQGMIFEKLFDHVTRDVTAEGEILERLQELISGILYDHVTRDITAEEEVLRELFEDYRQHLVTMQVSHILIEAREGEATPEEKQAAREKAQELITRLNAGENFAQLARQYSDCPSGAEGGNLSQHFTELETGFVSEFVIGAYELSSVGDFSQEPVATQFGYHIILVIDKIPTFEEFRERVEFSVLQEEREAVFNEYLLRIYEEADIVNYLVTEEDN